jgi:ribosomal protein L7/L12
MLEQPKPPDPEVVADAHRLARAGADCETILVFLRDRKFDKIDSIKTMRLLYNLSMSEAKDLIDHSAAWSDRFHSDMKLRETAMRALRDLAASKDPSLPRIELPEPEEPDS